MKIYFLLVAMLAGPNIVIAEEVDFDRLSCTQAITWAAAQIASPPPPNFTPAEWNKFMENGGAETSAMQILSALPGSPCFKSFDIKNPASGTADGEKR